MRAILEISVDNLPMRGKSLLTLNKLKDMTDWKLINTREPANMNVVIYVLQVDVTPAMLRELRDKGYIVREIS